MIVILFKVANYEIARQKMLEELTILVREAGSAALVRQQALAGLSVTSKGHLDFVTDADRAVEVLIADRIALHHPDDGFLGEEGRRLEGRSGRTWIVDPIDGTHTFVRGGASWAVSIGVVSDRAVAAALNAPVERNLLVAEAGKGYGATARSCVNAGSKASSA